MKTKLYKNEEEFIEVETRRLSYALQDEAIKLQLKFTQAQVELLNSKPEYAFIKEIQKIAMESDGASEEKVKENNARLYQLTFDGENSKYLGDYNNELKIIQKNYNLDTFKLLIKKIDLPEDLLKEFNTDTTSEFWALQDPDEIDAVVNSFRRRLGIG